MNRSRQDDASPHRLTFGRHVLDLERGSLFADGTEIALRPKTFAVLRFLADRPGQLVSKEELFAAVWPNLVVSDDTLVQSVGELRRALGEEGAKLIVTVPRRGYRFEGSNSRTASPRRRRSAIVIAALLVSLAFAVGIWINISNHPASVPDATGKPAIAVLPFENQSDDPAREYLADGLSQDLINSLGRFSGLTVMSWNAVAGYKGAGKTPDDIARDLAVRYLFEGGVRYSAGRLRVSAQLVDVQGRVLWSARFDEASNDVFALQDRITREVAGALAIRVTEFEQRRVAAQPTTNFDAYDYVLRARPALVHPTRAGIADARGLLRAALSLDPEYAAAHSALGETFHVAISMGWAEAPDEYFKRVETHANEALRFDTSDVRARILLGRTYIAYNRFAEAQAQIDQAIAVNPNDADALAGRGNVLVWLGKTDAAIESLEFALRIDPELNTFDRFALALAYYLQGRYDQCVAQAELNRRKGADAGFNHAILAAAYAQLGNAAEAAHAAAEVKRTDPAFDGADFGNKFLNPEDLEKLRAGLRKAGLYGAR